MEVNVTIVDDSGTAYEGRVTLQAIGARSIPSDRSLLGPSNNAPLDLDLPMRPFMKRYGTGLSGPKRFVLLLAHTVRGDLGTSRPVGEIEALWCRMTGLIGNFNSAYPNRAKDAGWVDATRPGVYVLLPGWQRILKAAPQSS